MKMKYSILAVSFLTGFAIGAEELPNKHLLPTTKAIYEIIMAKQKAEAAKHEAYTQDVPLVEGAKIDLVPIPAGKFKIGSDPKSPNHKPDEAPQKEIEIKTFWMGKHEITWDSYYPYMDNGKPRNKDGTLDRDSDATTSDAPSFKGDETLVDTITQPTPAAYAPMHNGMSSGYEKGFPAISVTHHAANKYCEWLSAQTGYFYRLPTEVEWEYACRAGTTTAYSFGDDVSKLSEYAWFRGNSEFVYHKVGQKKPNPWGLYDMHGNASELSLDQYVPDAYAKIKDGALNPWIPATNRYPTLFRGGHWDAEPEMLRSAARGQTSPQHKTTDPNIPKSIWYFSDAFWVGFRIVRPSEVPSLEEMHKAWNMGPGSADNDNAF
jgi:formylglycine-generating enzyme required for sulfatase activity